MSANYLDFLNRDARIALSVDFTTERGVVVDYALVLLAVGVEGVATIRVYDSAHGYNEMHRYTKGGGKQPGTKFHSGSLGEGMRAAIEDVKRNYPEMVEGWRAR